MTLGCEFTGGESSWWRGDRKPIMDVKQLFKSLKKEAECPLCLQTVKNPKTLPCLHSFCPECLDEVASFARRQLQTTIKCPVCQTSFPIPDTDTFVNLPSSFHLNRLVDVLALKDGTVQTQKCNTCDKNNPATSYCFVLPGLSVRILFSIPPTLQGYKRSSKCFYGQLTSSRCARVDPKARHVFTAISRRSTNGILLWGL